MKVGDLVRFNDEVLEYGMKGLIGVVLSFSHPDEDFPIVAWIGLNSSPRVEIANFLEIVNKS